MWRALLTFPAAGAASAAGRVLTVLFLAAEAALWPPALALALGLWRPAARRPLRLADGDLRLLRGGAPEVLVLVPCCGEPAEVLEGTLCAALSLDWPGGKLRVVLLDDSPLAPGLSTVHAAPMAVLCRRLEARRRQLGLRAPLEYLRRPKAPGVPHHAKAGNLNFALLGMGLRADYVLVLDADMVPRRELLRRALPQFLRPGALAGLRSAGAGRGGDEGVAAWRELCRPAAGFVQAPQRFYNVARGDPLGHAARFFYGPMLRGWDGLGACPCVGTGVVFDWRALAANGGQAVGSVTEDYKTALQLLAGGHWSRYLEEDLVYGQAPEDVQATFKQRYRWAVGSVQILFSSSSPLVLPGLSAAQRAVFLSSLWQYLEWGPALVLVCTPLVYLVAFVAPMDAPLLEFMVFFSVHFVLSRLWLFCACKVDGLSSLHLLRGSQAYVYMIPTHIAACVRVGAELLSAAARRCGGGGCGGRRPAGPRVAFKVTQKRVEKPRRDYLEALAATWPLLLYYLAFLGVVVQLLARMVAGDLDLGAAQGLLGGRNPLTSLVIALLWGFHVCVLIWPPVSALLPGFLAFETGAADASASEWGSSEKITDRIHWRVLSRMGLTPRTPGHDDRNLASPRKDGGPKPHNILRERALQTVLSEIDWDIVSPRVHPPARLRTFKQVKKDAPPLNAQVGARCVRGRRARSASGSATGRRGPTSRGVGLTLAPSLRFRPPSAQAVVCPRRGLAGLLPPGGLPPPERGHPRRAAGCLRPPALRRLVMAAPGPGRGAARLSSAQVRLVERVREEEVLEVVLLRLAPQDLEDGVEAGRDLPRQEREHHGVDGLVQGGVVLLRDQQVDANGRRHEHRNEEKDYDHRHVLLQVPRVPRPQPQRLHEQPDARHR